MDWDCPVCERDLRAVYETADLYAAAKNLDQLQRELKEWKRRAGVDGEMTVACSKCFDPMPNYATGDPPLCEKCREIKKIRSELKEAVADYLKVVDKFDACRGMLATIYEERTGKLPNPPEDYEGAWHEWLIERLGEGV